MNIIYPVSGNGSGSGAMIDDNAIALNKTWSSNKINSKFVEIKSEAPTLSLPEKANEDTKVTITITNYKDNTDYYFNTDAGDIDYNGGNTATLTTKEVEEDTQFTVACYAVEAGKTRSDTTTENITVLNVPAVADGSINNADFNANADTNDGFEY